MPRLMHENGKRGIYDAAIPNAAVLFTCELRCTARAESRSHSANALRWLAREQRSPSAHTHLDSQTARISLSLSLLIVQCPLTLSTLLALLPFAAILIFAQRSFARDRHALASSAAICPMSMWRNIILAVACQSKGLRAAHRNFIYFYFCLHFYYYFIERLPFMA